MGTKQRASGRAGNGPGAYDKSSWDEWIEDTGIVIRLLNDADDEGPHQRFVVRLASGQTLLVAHNLEIAERVPLGIGDRVGFRGVFEWNREGGILHWTHHDPQNQGEDGYLDFRGKRFL
jgi:hypothetical protein